MTTYEAKSNGQTETLTLPKSDVVLKVRTQYIGKEKIGVVTPIGRIGGQTLEEFSQKLRDLVDRGAEHIILDLERVMLLSSDGLREMYQYLQELPIIIVNPSASALTTMKLADSQDPKIDQQDHYKQSFFEEYETVWDAIFALKSKEKVH